MGLFYDSQTSQIKLKPILGGVGVIILIIYLLSGINRVTPTEVGFKISNAGDYRGLDTLPTVTGYNMTLPGFTYIVTLPTTQQHVAWTGDNELVIACMGGAGFKMDVGFNYRVNPFLASKIYLKYRTNDLESITHTYLKNVVRGTMQDFSSTMTVDSMLNKLGGFEDTVRKTLTVRLAKEGFIVDQFNIQKQPIPTDQNLAVAIGNKITAKQNAETSTMQLQQTNAEQNKKISEARGDSTKRVIDAQAQAVETITLAKAQAEGVRLVKDQLSVAGPQYLEYKRIEKWNGSVPTSIFGGGNGSPIPLLNMK